MTCWPYKLIRLSKEKVCDAMFVRLLVCRRPVTL